MKEYKPPAAMKHIGGLFERYRTTIKAPQGSVESEAILVIKTVTGFTVKKEQLVYTVSTKTLSLNVPSVLKTEVLFKRDQILQQLQKNLGSTNAPQVLR